MKMFMNFMKHSYNSYFVMDKHGEYHPVTRAVCFAPSYNKMQRWYWDDENHTVAVRLPLTKQGLEIGNAHLAGLKKDERDMTTKLQCVGFGTKQCLITCAECDYADRCTSKERDNNGFKCRRKCIDCPSYICKTVEADRTVESDEGASYNPYELVSESNPQTETEEQAEIEALMSALKTLTDAQQELIRDIYWNEMTEREIAPLLGLKSSKTVNYRKQVILDILRSDKLLKSFFETL